MRSLFYPGFNTLEVQEAPTPTPGHGEVLLQVSACGICGSELETFKAQSARRNPPLIMGHEFCGTVYAVGENVDSTLIGQRFVCNSLVSCGHCICCSRGDTHLCGNRQLFGMHRAGAFAEYVTAPTDVLIPWPDGIPAGSACLAEPLANGVHVVNLTRHLTIRSALVIGAGPIGLMCQQALQAMRSAQVMVCDFSLGRLEVAAKLGATRTFCSKDSDVAAEALHWTEGEGVDLVVDAAGSSATKRLSLTALRSGGAAVWIGLHGNTVEIDTYDITLSERQVLGTYAAKKEELAEALELMRTGKVDVTSWVDSVPLDQGVEGFRQMLNPGEHNLKSILIP